MKLTVTRAFLLGGNVQEVGKHLDLPDRQARELMALGKAAAAQALPAQAGPMTTETVPAVVKGKASKEKQDAGE